MIRTCPTFGQCPYTGACPLEPVCRAGEVVTRVHDRGVWIDEVTAAPDSLAYQELAARTPLGPPTMTAMQLAAARTRNVDVWLTSVFGGRREGKSDQLRAVMLAADVARRARALTFVLEEEVIVCARAVGPAIRGVVIQKRAYNDALDGALLIRFGLCTCQRWRSAQWVSANHVFHLGEPTT